MIKKLLCFILVLSSLCACSGKKQEMFSESFMGPFDTIFQVIAYEESRSMYDDNFKFIQDEFTRLHQLYDKYNDYEGINNIKTINDNAGIKPVVVDPDLYYMIDTALYYQQQIGNKVNIALGPVLNIWHNYRELDNGTIPTLSELQEANQYTDVSKIILDQDNMTVYVSDSNMSIDVGAVAKGYACEVVKQKLIQKGLDDFLISAGGNVVSYGKRPQKKEKNSLSEHLPSSLEYYTVDIATPASGAFANVPKIAALTLQNGESVVTSGSYQRFYVVNGENYHHIIDPKTLMPGTNFKSVSVIVTDSGMGDAYSTALFLLSYEEGLQLVESTEGLEAMWVMDDGEQRYSSGFQNYTFEYKS